MNIKSNQLRNRVWAIGSFVTVAFSETHSIFLKRESELEKVEITENLQADTFFKNILPVYRSGHYWLLLLGENGALVQIKHALGDDPEVELIQCKIFLLFSKIHKKFDFGF